MDLDWTSLPPVPQHGLSLASLRKFCAEHTGKLVPCTDGANNALIQPFELLTTVQVCFSLVKPATLDSGPGGEPCTYVELLLERWRRQGGQAPAPADRATVFVSHAWSYVFTELVHALESLPGAESEYFWIDMCGLLRSRFALCSDWNVTPSFVGAQHKAPVLPQEWWTNAFKDAVISIGHTVLVLQPWEAPLPLTRSWCIWEIFCTLSGAKRLTVCHPPAQATSFQAALLSRFGAIETALSKIDARRAEAFKEEDRANIYAAVEGSEGGFTAVNRRVHDQLREWLAQSGREALAELSMEEAKVEESDDDDYDDSGGRDRRAKTLSLTHNLARLLFKQSKLSEAESLFLRAAEGRRALLGPSDEGTLLTATGLAHVLRAQKRLTEAEQAYRDVLATRAARGGDVSLDCEQLNGQNHLANLLRQKGERAEAEALYVAVLAARRQLLGPGHGDTWQTMNGLALLCQEAGRLVEAEGLVREVLTQQKMALGEGHPDTLWTGHNLASLLRAAGGLAQLAEAQAEAGKAARGREEKLGREHQLTKQSWGLVRDIERELAAVRAAEGEEGGRWE